VAQHRFTAATLPWEKVNCIVLTLATKVHITVAQNKKNIQFLHTVEVHLSLNITASVQLASLFIHQSHRRQCFTTVNAQ